jgi:hypothetical protein
MYCCSNCFTDTELIGFIFSNTTETATCDFCGTENTKVIDPRELEELFQPIISLFKPVSEIGIKVTEGRLFHEKIQDNWHIFRIPDLNVIKQLVSTILSGIYKEDDSFLNDPVEITILSKLNTAEIHEKKWDNFAEEIKYKNRYFLNETIDLELLKDLLLSLRKNYNRGKIFYRGRLSESVALPIDQMGKPPKEKASSGRANPNGIPYLYVSTALETILYECRSSYLDFLSIAEFRVIEDLNIVSLRGIKNISPFVFGENLESFVIHQKYLERLEKELSRPVRKFDKELDYLPSQYLCEYVKSLGFDAIEYGSSLKVGGINLAIFNDYKLEGRSVSVYEITSVDFKVEKVAMP